MIDVNINTNVADNTIVINNRKFVVDDTTAKAVFDILIGKVNLTAPTTEYGTAVVEKQVEAKVEKKVNSATETLCNDVKCKWQVEEVITPANKKFYRITDGIFTAGKWRQSQFNPDEEYRIPTNLEAHRIATNKVKALDGIKSVEMPGGWFAYGFATKKSAEKALEKLPERIQKVEIASYINEHGAIKAKAVKRKIQK